MVKRFNDYFNIRENEIDPDDKNGLPGGDDGLGVLHQAVDIAWKQDKPKLLATLRDIAQRMEKGQLHLLLDKLDGNNMHDLNHGDPVAPRSSGDRYVVPAADGGMDGAVH
jgi:hypothetical protein